MASSTNGFNSRNCHAKGGGYDGGTIDDGFYFLCVERKGKQYGGGINKCWKRTSFQAMKGLVKQKQLQPKN